MRAAAAASCSICPIPPSCGPEVVVVDPPRTGCERPLLDAVITVRPERLVYVSCNPSTLAKDCKVLLDGGFRLEWIQPVDMFPQTSHVVCCSLIS